MRSYIMVALALIGVLSVAIVAYAMNDSDVSGLLNVDLRDVSVKQAIDTLFEGRGLKYYIQPGVKGRIVELKLKGITFEEGLSALGNAAGFSYTTQDGAYIISPIRAIDRTMKATTPIQQPVAPVSDYMEQPPEAVDARGPAQQSAPPVVINNSMSSTMPSGYGVSQAAYPPPFYNIGGIGYQAGWFNPFFNIGNGPFVFGNFPQPPPPSGWFSPSVERFMRFEWAVPSRPGFAAPYPYFYP